MGAIVCSVHGTRVIALVAAPVAEALSSARLGPETRTFASKQAALVPGPGEPRRPVCGRCLELWLAGKPLFEGLPDSTPEVIEQGPGIAPDDVTAFEQGLGIAFANDYRVWLIANNGGRLDPYQIRVEGLANLLITVEFMYGIRGDGDSLANNYALAKKLIGDTDVLPIGRDNSGNWFCLILGGVNDGEILYLDRQNAEMYFVTKTFDRFLRLLKRGPI